MKIANIHEYLKEIKKLGKENDSNTFCSLFSRGEPEDYKDTACVPGIFRKQKFIENEHNMFRDFIIANPDEFNNDRLTIDKLTKMQHYSLPTRLLDVSENALVSLFMACESKENNDSIVWIFRVPKEKIKYYDSDTVSVIANLAKRPNFIFPKGFEKISENITNTEHRKKYLEDFNKIDDIKYLLHDIKEDKPYFKDEIWPEHLYSVICVKPRQNNRRIIRQQGLFLLFGNNKKDKLKHAEIKDSGITKEKIIIDARWKKQIIEDLALMGITKATVYPDMDKVAEYLKEKYS
ncbi:MAG TPA: FRG domain-containing protein [bacterium]|jgi:hypothetical protein|nr:FRG domain-containing protein [bacterium]